MKILLLVPLVTVLAGCGATTLEDRIDDWQVADDKRNKVVYRTIANPLFGSRLRYPIQIDDESTTK